MNFNLPKPFGRFWYRGGNGGKSIPVKKGEIEWGEFYRRSMPVIWSAVDHAIMHGLYLQRLNEFGQHDYKKYYYLWEAMDFEIPVSTQEYREKTEEDERNQEPDVKNGDSAESGDQGGGVGEDVTAEGAEGFEEPGEVSARQAGAEGGSEGIPSAQEMQEFLNQMQQNLEQAMEQSGRQDEQKAMRQMIGELQQMQEALGFSTNPQDMSGELSNIMGELSEMLEGMEERLNEKLSGGRADGEGFEKNGVSGLAEYFDFQHQGGAGNTTEGADVVFKCPDSKLLDELSVFENSIESKFLDHDEDGNLIMKQVTSEEERRVREELSEQETRAQQKELQLLEQLKTQHQKRMETMYKEMSGLDGRALRLYIKYMEEEKELIGDLVNFFVDKFELDKDYAYAKHQRRGARLERGWQRNVIGMKGRKPVIRPESFERKRPPEKPQFVWSLIIDNTGSVGGMIEEEKKLAVALIETAKKLKIPLEIVIYAEGGCMFLKQFDQDAYGDDLQKIVLLRPTVRNQQDTKLLRATQKSQMKFADKFNRSYNFTFFITDGLARSSDSLHDLIQKYKRDAVIIGIGLAQAAKTIEKEFGKNSLKVQDPTMLSRKFTQKLEDLIEQTFD